jgi:hypothetical protein
VVLPRDHTDLRTGIGSLSIRADEAHHEGRKRHRKIANREVRVNFDTDHRTPDIFFDRFYNGLHLRMGCSSSKSNPPPSSLKVDIDRNTPSQNMAFKVSW